MHERDRDLIQAISNYFGGIGHVSKPNKASTVEFRVNCLKDIANVILPHFDQYPLLTKKRIDYRLFKQIVLLMLSQQHHTLSGTQKIVNLKASLNLGLSDELKKSFPNRDGFSIKNLDSETENSQTYSNIDSNWLAGFASGESNFFIAVQKSKTISGISISLRFSISQHSRDLLLVKSFIKFFGGGFIINYKKRPLCEFIVAKMDIILQNIIPFFDKHPILGSKHLSYLDFKKVAFMVKNKQHLNADKRGLQEVLQLKKTITRLNSNKSMNNHRIEQGTEK